MQYDLFVKPREDESSFDFLKKININREYMYTNCHTELNNLPPPLADLLLEF